MEQDQIKLEAFTLENKKFVQTCFYNPVISFLAFPAISEADFDSYFENYMNEENCLIISVNGICVGCIILEFNHIFRIRSIFILPEYRGNKYSRKALEQLKERIPNTEFSVFIHDQQREHIHLFERCHFKKTDIVQEFEFENKAKKFIKFVN